MFVCITCNVVLNLLNRSITMPLVVFPKLATATVTSATYANQINYLKMCYNNYNVTIILHCSLLKF